MVQSRQSGRNPRMAILFDLGNTLAAYYGRSEFPDVLRQAIARVSAELAARGLLSVAPQEVHRRVAEEDHEAPDGRVRPLEKRLARIFGLPGAAAGEADMEALCRAFLEPVFALGRVYDDAVPALRALRAAGLKTALVSNTPWGSPAEPWREELRRLGLAPFLDETVFCRDVGWRKPARQIFECALSRLGLAADECLFVGDDPRWDVAGPAGVGMDAVLVDPSGRDTGPGVVRSLRELPDIVRA